MPDHHLQQGEQGWQSSIHNPILQTSIGQEAEGQPCFSLSHGIRTLHMPRPWIWPTELWNGLP